MEDQQAHEKILSITDTNQNHLVLIKMATILINK